MCHNNDIIQILSLKLGRNNANSLKEFKNFLKRFIEKKKEKDHNIIINLNKF